MGIPGEGQTFERLSRRLHLTAAGERFRSYDSHVAVLFDEMEKDLRDWDSFGILRVGPALPLGRIAFLRKIYATLQGLTDVKHKSSPRIPHRCKSVPTQPAGLKGKQLCIRPFFCESTNKNRPSPGLTG